KIASGLAPDVFLIDVEPPVEQEAEALRHLRELWPVPVVLFTALAGPDREALGVVGARVLAKPVVGLARGTNAMLPEIEAAVGKAHQDDLLRWRKKRGAALVS